jgi:hypothetical protein
VTDSRPPACPVAREDAVLVIDDSPVGELRQELVGAVPSFHGGAGAREVGAIPFNQEVAPGSHSCLESVEDLNRRVKVDVGHQIPASVSEVVPEEVGLDGLDLETSLGRSLPLAVSRQLDGRRMASTFIW